jgi:hypothetical protein
MSVGLEVCYHALYDWATSRFYRLHQHRKISPKAILSRKKAINFDFPMIDTITIKLYNHDFTIQKPELFTPNADHLYNVKKCRLIQKSDDNLYYPKLILSEYYDRKLKAHSKVLMITFSVAKMRFYNNLEEVSTNDFSIIEKRLEEYLSMVGIATYGNAILEAKIQEVHFSKNVDITDYAKSSYVINMLSKAKVQRLRIDTKSYNGNGSQVLFTSKSYAITFYDKTREVKKDYQSMKDDGFLKQSQKRALDYVKDREILRMEVRLLKPAKIQNICSKLTVLSANQIRLLNLFDSTLSKSVCQHYLDKILESNPEMLEGDSLDRTIDSIMRYKYKTKGKMLADIGSAYIASTCGKSLLQEISKKLYKRHKESMAEINNHKDNSTSISNVLRAKMASNDLIKLRPEFILPDDLYKNDIKEKENDLEKKVYGQADLQLVIKSHSLIMVNLHMFLMRLDLVI